MDHHILASERMTKVEMRVQSLEVGQGRMETVLERITDFMTAQASKSGITEQMVVAVKERSDEHSKHITELKTEQVDIGRVLESQKSQLNALKGVAAAIGTAILTYLASQHFHF
ncbi:MAG: hypothetical protein H0W02_10200 [Ktedonobacteraceae bacterium]|nr:hypothetical protein [Ktedonobacteraceae bacterium]